MRRLGLFLLVAFLIVGCSSTSQRTVKPAHFVSAGERPGKCNYFSGIVYSFDVENAVEIMLWDPDTSVDGLPYLRLFESRTSLAKCERDMLERALKSAKRTRERVKLCSRGPYCGKGPGGIRTVGLAGIEVSGLYMKLE
ncbi:MAG: hypothetical protein KJ970_03375 [Candidatus Eisenbacteria bacterium]|uniref:Lipoprotein n=1 Tax=Eiseniibacteriota bacterium TaxID=2212470 RepID=A0A948RUZ6_UNCEI|nr:hypothetical protein [Candidatus Eisenbacteria bacterium]MBU1949507.1 hypothetical protein [Candidatus Eisenbacteria bacterium]MBU2689942.1 hypothetical protein [Candidatus Eisenbacteria bacterium]